MNCFEYENQNSNVFLTYKIGAEETIDSMSLGMISNNSIPGFLDTVYTQMNMDCMLKYKVTAMITLQKFMSNPIGRKSFISFVESVNDMLVQAEEYMIDLPFIVFDPENIYINISDKKASFVCLPIVEKKNDVDVKTFFRNLVMNAQFDQSENCDYVARFMNYFNSITTFSNEDFKNFLETVKQAPVAKPAPAPVSTPVAAAPVNNVAAAVQSASQPAVSQPSAPSATPVKIPTPAVNNTPVKAQIPSNGISVPNSVPQKAEEPEKKSKFSLFGKKEAKPAAQPKEDKKASKPAAMPAMPGFAVPGQPVPAKPAAAAIPTPAVKIPTPAVQSTPVATPISTPVVKQSVGYSSSAGKLDFGETVMLNFSDGGDHTVMLFDEAAPQKVCGLVRTKTNETINITKTEFCLGRDAEFSDYRVDNPAVGRVHASILRKGDAYYVIDQNSRNHTYVNGTQIASQVEVQLNPGDELRLANEVFKFDFI